MRNARFFFGLTILLASALWLRAQENTFWGSVEAGPFAPGFRLIETADASRSFPAAGGQGVSPRPMRIYVWYPAQPASSQPMRFDDYVRLARADFRPPGLPVPLAKGFQPAELEALCGAPVQATRDAAPASGKFPLLVLGQGLFYESPLAHFVLCEFLASHGYVVATSPLLGTRYRLVNLSAEDIETETRDMEFVLGEAGRLPFAEAARPGVIGYDLGGMAGLLLVMRHPEASAFLSLDSGILDKHYTGLPASHPGYREDRFRIPWMHMTQARFIRTEKDRAAASSLFERKAFGPSLLVHVPTASHGQFSSYAALGIKSEVPGYWGLPSPDEKQVYERICRLALAFFDAYVRNDPAAAQRLAGSGTDEASGAPGFKIERKEAPASPPTEAELIDLIIEKGPRQAAQAIERVRREGSGPPSIGESVLNWLGVHFLYWWGREDEAVGVFELNVSLYPGSWAAHDSLGEAYANRGRKDEAIRSYRKSLELNPDNANAKAALERLGQAPKKDPEKG
jgi:pimeloyl-ACP methyl ester carboxylesterase